MRQWVGVSAPVVSLLVGCLFLYGCSGCSDSPSSGVSGGASDAADASDVVRDGAGDTSPDSESPDISGDTDGDSFRCPDPRACGSSCCARDEECVMGTCREACSGTRCGEQNGLCCTGDDVCIFDSCQTPGQTCQNSFECPDDKYCEETLGRCLPRSAQSNQCTVRPPVGQFTPTREGEFDGVQTNGRTYDKSIASPTVADIDADGLPEIGVLLYRGSLSGALIAVVNGEDRSLVAFGAVENIQPNAAGIAVGQLDSSTPELEIVAPKRGGGLVALKLDRSNGTLDTWWTNETGGLGEIDTESAPAIADIEGDGSAEIVYGFSLLTANGNIWNGLNGGPAGSQRSNAAATSVVDLDDTVQSNGNRDLEIVSGNRAMKTDGSMLWDISGAVPDGFSAVGDFGNDGDPEVVTVADGDVYVLDGTSGSIDFGPQPIPGGGEGGPPTIADFDGDDFVEFAAAGEGQYTVYDLDCQGSNPDQQRCASGRSDGVLWTVGVQDTSSSRTGSSVFDFEGDGKAEVVYNDECFLRVFDGANGDVLFERANTSRTGSEYPIIVDVDKDFDSEIVVVSNNDQIERDGCERNFQNYPEGGTTGVFVYGDSDDNWVPTRNIWNEHAYHITNVLADGTVPVQEPIHYKSDVTNSFRLNVQPDGLFNAPDLVVENLEVEGVACNASRRVEVRVTLKNEGALGVGPGVEVEVTAEVGGSTTTVGTIQTQNRLLPAETETRTLQWTLPQSASGQSFSVEAVADSSDSVSECNEGNNSSSRQVDPSSFELDELTISSLSVSDGRCGFQSWDLPIDVTVQNSGQADISANVPIVIEAVDGSASEIRTVRTSRSLKPGDSEAFQFTWTVDPSFRNSTFEVRATVDPETEVYACGGNSGSVRANCRAGN